jgi:hypothetical protein
MSRQSVQISYDRLNAVPVILASHKHLHLQLEKSKVLEAVSKEK